MLQKSQIFSFLISLTVTFVVGFFIWNTFGSFSDAISNRVASAISRIDLKFLATSGLPVLKTEDVGQVIDFSEGSAADENLLPESSEPNFVDFDSKDDPSPTVTEEQKKQDLLDDIQEKLDIIAAQIQILKEEQNIAIQDEKQDEEIQEDEEEEQDNENKEENKKIDKTLQIYPKILISEVQIAPIEQRFIKLFNPNSEQVDLTGWYLQRKTETSDSWNSLVSSAKFEGKTISANSYFLISREIVGSDILDDITITENNSLALKNPNREISNEFLTTSPSVAASGGSGDSSDGGSAPIVYPKILISEVQIAPIEQRFVELYNPSSQEVDLTDWYLQRKDANDALWGSFVSSTNFQNKIISANGYFIISTEIQDADILTNITLSNDNSLAFKNPNGEISDKLGFGLALDFELLAIASPGVGQSIGRKILTDGSEQDTDNNLEDFELNEPTPKAKNITFVEPLPSDPTPITPVETPSDAPSIIAYAISNLVISPNNDSVEDSTDIDWKFSEEVKVSVDIIDYGGAVIVKDFYKSDKVTNPRTKTWDGKDDLGIIVPNGVYIIKVTITNFAGNSITDENKTITVNSEPLIVDPEDPQV